MNFVNMFIFGLLDLVINRLSGGLKLAYQISNENYVLSLIRGLFYT